MLRLLVSSLVVWRQSIICSFHRLNFSVLYLYSIPSELWTYLVWILDWIDILCWCAMKKTIQTKLYKLHFMLYGETKITLRGWNSVADIFEPYCNGIPVYLDSRCAVSVFHISIVFFFKVWLLACLQVGPKKKDLKVKNFEEFQFRPRELVANICRIYVNLGDEEENFCRAVSCDGRSYSPSLFEQAESILCKIHEPADVIARFHEVGEKIQV